MYVSFIFSLIIKVYYICKHCSQSYAKNPTRFAKHLKKCTAFQKTISKESQHTSAFSNAMNARTTSQSEINFPRLTAKQKLELHIKAAMWCLWAIMHLQCSKIRSESRFFSLSIQLTYLHQDMRFPVVF